MAASVAASAARERSEVITTTWGCEIGALAGAGRVGATDGILL
jgi:hypothetical protein